jgi:hypothetical protein
MSLYSNGILVEKALCNLQVPMVIPSAQKVDVIKGTSTSRIP